MALFESALWLSPEKKAFVRSKCFALSAGTKGRLGMNYIICCWLVTSMEFLKEALDYAVFLTYVKRKNSQDY